MRRTTDTENFLTAMIPGGIEASEAIGQRELCHSSELPVDSRPPLEAVANKFGLTLGYVGDDIFRPVTLPAGWKLVPSDHSMWSHLVDDKGRERAEIFYKAAFYDRSAHIGWNTRYMVSFEARGEHPNDEHRYNAVDRDGKKILDAGEWAKSGSGDCGQHARQWLTDNYPQWEDVTAYW